MRRAVLITLFSLVTLFSGTAAAAGLSSMDSLPFFYQRTAYLENLLQAGAWLANPALITTIDKTELFVSNTGLLGGKYGISSIRIMWPGNRAVSMGAGLTGTTTTEGRSFSGSNGSGQFNSSFNFSRPSIEAAAGWTPRTGGSVGALIATGTESFPGDTLFTLPQYYFFWGFGAGVLTPWLANTLQLSFSMLSVRHYVAQAWWDDAAKAGLLVSLKNGAVRGSVEYCFSLDNRILWLRNKPDIPTYEVFKTALSIGFRSIAGLIIGYSVDAPRIQRDNGSTFHGGIELRRSDIYPYWGGAEIGLSPSPTRSNQLSLMFRFWVGYSFKKQQKTGNVR